MGDIAEMLGINPSSVRDLVIILDGRICETVQDSENWRSIRVIPEEKGEIWILETERRSMFS